MPVKLFFRWTTGTCPYHQPLSQTGPSSPRSTARLNQNAKSYFSKPRRSAVCSPFNRAGGRSRSKARFITSAIRSAVMKVPNIALSFSRAPETQGTTFSSEMRGIPTGLSDLAARWKAAEALLELATGGKPRISLPYSPVINPFNHPDALRRFRVMNNVEELQRAPGFPCAKWTSPCIPAATARGTRPQWPGPGVRFGWHRQDDCRPASSRVPSPKASRVACAVGDLFANPGEGSAHPAEATAGQ